MQEAQRQEAIDPLLAAATWRQCLALLPPESMEYRQITARAAILSSGMFAGPGAERDPLRPTRSQAREPKDTWLSALLKTGGSMALSIFMYYNLNWPKEVSNTERWEFAIGFVFLILIHELGHVIANWHYGLKQSPPLFVPFMGAVIFLKQNPPNAKAEAVVGIAGPVAGTAGALACYALALARRDEMLLVLAYYAFFMNLFNMIPCPPLDGGRVAAAISTWLWLPGVALFVAAIFRLGGRRDWITWVLAFWILQSALPRVRQALLGGARAGPYYRITLGARIAVIASYALLTGLLLVMLKQYGPIFTRSF
jgi:Zn-dependent protease